MEGFVQVISSEILKPSSSAPLHPNKLKLSYIDQLLLPLYIPLIFFYEGLESKGLTTSNHPQICQRLKQSLLNILPSYYPLAGRLKNNHSVDCNDAGVEFIQARARARLNDVVCKDDHLKQYLPPDSTTSNHGTRSLLLVQITIFECGGVVIGTCFSHKISDMASAMAFLNAWAATFRGEAETVPPSFGTTAYFPSFRLVPWSRFNKLLISNEKFMTRRFVFNKKNLDILREAATSSCETTVKDPSRVELVSAFIWKHFMEARLKKQKCIKKNAALIAVNVRTRMKAPRLFENVYGNYVMSALTFPDQDLCFHNLIGKLRRSIRRVRGNNVSRAIIDIIKLGFLLLIGKLEHCLFTSWIGFPTYELDYGWGKPIWFATPSMPSKNLIVLVSSKSGEDIDAIVTMMPEDLNILDSHIKLISTNT